MGGLRLGQCPAIRFTKIAVLICLAHYLDRNRRSIGDRNVVLKALAIPHITHDVDLDGTRLRDHGHHGRIDIHDAVYRRAASIPYGNSGREWSDSRHSCHDDGTVSDEAFGQFSQSMGNHGQ